VRWGPALPYWVGVAVLAVGAVVFLCTAHHLAGKVGEQVLWKRWNGAPAAVEGAPEEAMAEL
jgi:MFS transporter, ACDE family, multidrug resistance protein